MARKPVSYLAGSVLLGTAIGTVLGLLTAPRSGSDLRREIAERADSARKQAGEAGRSIPQRMASLRDGMAHLREDGMQRIARLPSELRDRGRKGKTPGTQVTVEGRDPHEEGDT